MKRSLVFAYDGHYAGGGKDDVIGSFDCSEEAIKAARSADVEYSDILDRVDGCWVPHARPPSYPGSATKKKGSDD